MTLIRAFALCALALLAACGAPDYTPVTFTVTGSTLVAEGEIGTEALEEFEEIMEDNPQLTTLELRMVGGSVDDETNLILAKRVRELGLNTRVPGDGLVASGGTDLFLAGVERVLEPGACVGVHAWATDEYTANDLPRSDPEHQEYLDYFAFVGIDGDFYWYTLEAAPAAEMHWMSAAEVDRYAVDTGPTPALGRAATCDLR